MISPPPNMSVAEGQSVILTCKVAGKPDPLIEWYRDTSLITGDRFNILPSGSLEIVVCVFCLYINCHHNYCIFLCFVLYVFYLKKHNFFGMTI